MFFEVRTSNLEAQGFSALARGLTFHLEPGPNARPYFPDEGPYDVRLGYARLPIFLKRLQAAGYRIDSQARLSPELRQVAGSGLFPIYREKIQAGLRVVDLDSRPLYSVRDPERIYERFEAIPPLVVTALLFIENRELLDPRHPHRNPAVEWDRLGKAVGINALTLVGHRRRVIGGSTLATQIEKFRHSPDGRTQSAREKLRQMLSASLRAYQGGAGTLPARRQIVVDYLNSVPLAAAPGHGEIYGLGDGLWIWYGIDFADANRLLTDPSAPAQSRARVYKQVLSLILAARRPSYYLVENRKALEDLSDRYLRIMAQAGLIDGGLREAAVGQALDVRARSPRAAVDFSERKGANLVRARLTTLLGMSTLYDVDRLDLTVQSTLDEPTQEAVTRILHSLRNPAVAAAMGLKGFHLLEQGDPARMIYSFTLYERGPGVNRLRVQTDNLDEPLDINAGAKLDLGSTAKLRTLITYLEVIATLHNRYAGLSAEQRRAVKVHPRDRLTAWAIEYLAKAPDAGLTAMLEAAMDRRYSASPDQAFFTGGGLQTFSNFNPDDNARVPSVREGFRDSVNLVFIRMMRDIVDHYLFEAPGSLARVLEDPADPRRQAYLTRFADREGSEFLRRFYQKYQSKTPEQALDLLLSGLHPTPHGLATIFRSVNPDAGVDALKALLAARLPGTAFSDRTIAELYEKYGPEKYSLMDRGYIARVHPLELWLLNYLRRNPRADLSRALSASAGERQEVYRWLFQSQRRNAQDIRIATLLELEAFVEIHRGWQRLGYPFASLTPSLATALGSSGDRPAALAELMGIILNQGVRYPTVLVEQLHFATDTPYETRFRYAGPAGQRVLSSEIAVVVRRALIGVVEQGTARGLNEALRREAGDTHVLGGKTGTGDHRYNTYGAQGRLIESRVVNRVATFAFVIDDRFFGTVTAYVPGPEAAKYEFTSALPVRLLGILMPALAPLIDAREPTRLRADVAPNGAALAAATAPR